MLLFLARHNETRRPGSSLRRLVTVLHPACALPDCFLVERVVAACLVRRVVMLGGTGRVESRAHRSAEDRRACLERRLLVDLGRNGWRADRKRERVVEDRHETRREMKRKRELRGVGCRCGRTR
jgi:hypothetical protein